MFSKNFERCILQLFRGRLLNKFLILKNIIPQKLFSFAFRKKNNILLSLKYMHLFLDPIILEKPLLLEFVTFFS